MPVRQRSTDHPVQPLLHRLPDLRRTDAENDLHIAAVLHHPAAGQLPQRLLPDKGRILTAMSVFFFDLIETPNHLAGPVDDPRIPAEVLGSALVVRRLEMMPVECVARGYLTGSGLLDYRRAGALCGIPLPPGLQEASKFDRPLFTPATKAAIGAHDENIGFGDVVDLVGVDRARELRDLTLDAYTQGAGHALNRGIIIADTKFEFGVDPHGDLRLADEVFTPDSSRYWRADSYHPGVVQQSFDKQFVRNWLTSPDSGWQRAGDQPPPPLPPAIVDATRTRYIEAYERISGLRFDDWIGPTV